MSAPAGPPREVAADSDPANGILADGLRRGRDRHLHFRRSRHVWLSRRLWRRRLVFWSGALLVGLSAVIFAMLADLAQGLFRSAVIRLPWLPLLVMPPGLALAAVVTARFFPEAKGSGIPQVIAAYHLHDAAERGRLLSLRGAVAKIALTLFGLLIGASIGREGPTVQIGAAITAAGGRIAGLGQRPGLILAGGAAGVAAAFNTPLAGIVFAIEEMARSYENRTSGLVLSTIVVSGIAALGLSGNYTYFGRSAAVLTTPAQWLAVPVCAVLGGLAGGLFSRLVVAAARGLPGAAGRWMRDRPATFAALCGLLVASIGVASGGLTYGTGYAEARHLVEGGQSMPVWFGPAKFAASLVSAVSGIPGGIFAPSLSVGAGLGAALQPLLPAVPPAALVLLGMAGYFAGVVQAPITAFVIVLEMTAGHALAIPLMATALIAATVSRLVARRPIYHALSRGFMPRTPLPARPPPDHPKDERPEEERPDS